MCALKVLTRSLGSYSARGSKPYLTPNHTLLSFITLFQQCNLNHWQHQHQSRRTLILESSASEFVKLHKLSGEDSGIIEVSLDGPEAKNAIGKELLQSLSHASELVNQNPYANGAMICSSVPGAFCAGADLKAVRVKTIAVIEGVALGDGLEMALACDIQICGEDALMGLPRQDLL